MYIETPITQAQQAELPYLVVDATPTGSAKPTGNKRQRRRIEQIHTEIRHLADELNDTLYHSKATDRPSVHSPADAAHLLQPFLEHLDHEEMWVLLLDTRNRVLKLVRLYSGSINSSQVRVNEIFRPAIVEPAPNIIIAHNHPSGDPTPSPDDVGLTRTIVQAGKLLDIDILDHLVIGRPGWVSLKERDLGFS